MDIGAGFNNAVANLYLNAQLAPGIRVALTTYLSSRHHNETWVKDGYLLIDESPIDVAPLNDAHEVRDHQASATSRSTTATRTSAARDNGNAMYNPFVGNLIMDAFTTEIGGEVYLRTGGLLAMGGVTGGEITRQRHRTRDSAARPTSASSASTGSSTRTCASASPARSTRRRSRSATRCTPATAPARATTSCSRTPRRPRPAQLHLGAASTPASATR